MVLRERIEAALYAADLFGLTSAPTPQRIAHVVMFELSKLADEWDDVGSKQYYDRRHQGPIEFADGVEHGIEWCADVLRGLEPTLPERGWS